MVPIWLKSHLSIPTLYSYVAPGEIWEIPITGHMWVIIVPANKKGNCDTMKVFLNYFACYEQSDLPKYVIAIFIISLYIHDITSFTVDSPQLIKPETITYGIGNTGPAWDRHKIVAGLNLLLECNSVYDKKKNNPIKIRLNKK
jgi:hypothetical protein